MKKSNAAKGFAKPQTQKFTTEILRRSLAPVPEGEESPRDVEVEIYTFKVQRGRGKAGWEECVLTAVELSHIRIYDLLEAWCKKHGDDSPWAFDGFLYRNRPEGEPIFRLSTSPFRGSGHVPAISEPDTPAAEIVAKKEMGRVIRKFN